MGHCHGLAYISPGFGFRPAFPCSITACASTKRFGNEGLCISMLTFGTVHQWMNINLFSDYWVKQIVAFLQWVITTKKPTSWEVILFHIPQVVWMSEVGIAGDFHLLKSPENGKGVIIMYWTSPWMTEHYLLNIHTNEEDFYCESREHSLRDGEQSWKLSARDEPHLLAFHLVCQSSRCHLHLQCHSERVKTQISFSH